MTTTDIRVAFDRAAQKRRSSLFRRFLRHPGGYIPLAIFVLIVLVGVFAPLLAPYGPKENGFERNADASWEHWLEDRGAHEVRLTPADVARLDDLVNDATVAGPRYSESQQASIDTEAAPPR